MHPKKNANLVPVHIHLLLNQKGIWSGDNGVKYISNSVSFLCSITQKLGHFRPRFQLFSGRMKKGRKYKKQNAPRKETDKKRIDKLIFMSNLPVR